MTIPIEKLPKHRRSRVRREMLCLTCCLGIALIGGCVNRRPHSTLHCCPSRFSPSNLWTTLRKSRSREKSPPGCRASFLFALVAGLSNVRWKSAQHVVPGEILARLDPKVQEADVEGAIAGVQAAEAKLRQVTSNFERQKALLKDGFTTQRDYDQAEQEYRSAQAMLDSAKAQLATARDNLAQTVLRAPSPGIITARHMEVGQVAQPGQAVFALAQDGPRDAVINVQESVFTGGFKEDIEIALVSDPKIKARGEVREVSPALNAAGAVRVKIAILKPPPEMVLGAAVRVSAHAKEREIAVLPWSALYSDGGKPAVWVVDPKSEAVALRRIEIEAYGNTDIVIRGGLRPGDLVVTVGTQLLRPAQQVAFAENNQ